MNPRGARGFVSVPVAVRRAAWRLLRCGLPSLFAVPPSGALSSVQVHCWVAKDACLAETPLTLYMRISLFCLLPTPLLCPRSFQQSGQHILHASKTLPRHAPKRCAQAPGVLGVQGKARSALSRKPSSMCSIAMYKTSSYTNACVEFHDGSDAIEPSVL